MSVSFKTAMVLVAASLSAFSAEALSQDELRPDSAGVSLPDSSIRDPLPTTIGEAARSDAEIFNEICGCIGKSVMIRKDSPDFQPVSWSVRGMNGELIRPRGETRSGDRVVLDLSQYDAGYYIVTLRDKNGRTLSHPLLVD